MPLEEWWGYEVVLGGGVVVVCGVDGQLGAGRRVIIRNQGAMLSSLRDSPLRLRLRLCLLTSWQLHSLCQYALEFLHYVIC